MKTVWEGGWRTTVKRYLYIGGSEESGIIFLSFFLGGGGDLVDEINKKVCIYTYHGSPSVFVCGVLCTTLLWLGLRIVDGGGWVMGYHSLRGGCYHIQN